MSSSPSEHRVTSNANTSIELPENYMRRTIALLILPLLVASVAFVGCGDDDDPIAVVNQSFNFKVGDTYTYDYYDRDMQNMQDATTKQVFVWTVLQTDLTMFSRSKVTEVEEVRYAADGTTETGRSKIYFSVDTDGQLFMYDLFGAVLNRFSGDLDLSAYLDGITKVWIHVGSTKDANARVLVDAPQLLNQTLTDVEVAGIMFDAQIVLGIRSQHLGRDSLTVAAGSYDAYSTDNVIRGAISNKDQITVSGIPIPANTSLVSDSVTTHFDLDLRDGILRQTLDGKTVSVAGLFSTDVTGFERELTAATHAAAD